MRKPVDNKGESLHKAASDMKLPRLRELLAEGVDPNIADPWGRTALQLAVRYAYQGEAESLEAVRILLHAGADINSADENGCTPLAYAALYGYAKLLKHLIAEGAEVNPRFEGMTPIAAIEGTPQLLRRRRRIIKILESAGGVR